MRPQDGSKGLVMPFGLMSARFTSMLSLIAAMLMIVDAAFATESGIDSSTVTVKVTGYGASVSEARADAVRQAMQRVLPQLVVSDVEVNQDEVLRDRVMSTMNGFVDKVEEHSVRREGDEIVISSSITVSTKRMTNFLGLQSKAANVDGLSLFSELNRESEQREVVAEILARTFRGFPSETIETKVTSIKPAADNPDEFIIEFTAGFRKEWIRSLEDTLKALAVASYEFKISDFSLGSHHFLAGSRLEFKYYELSNTVGFSSGNHKLTEFFNAGNALGKHSGRVRPFCITSGTKNKAHCYILPKGNYFKWFESLSSAHKNLAYIIAASKENGESTMLKGYNVQHSNKFFRATRSWPIPQYSDQPFGIDMVPVNSIYESVYRPEDGQLKYTRDSFVTANYVFVDKFPGSVRVSRTYFNLSQTKKLLILPVDSSSSTALLDVMLAIPATNESIMKAARDAALQK